MNQSSKGAKLHERNLAALIQPDSTPQK